MHKFLSFIKEFRFPKSKELHEAVRSFSQKELGLFFFVIIISVISMFVLLENINDKFLVDVPKSGGSITEGIIGTPTLINPVIAISDADKDLVSLVYSGLMRKMPNGTFAPDLADSYQISPDGLTYTFIIRKDARFQDGEKVTADDVVFTINKIKDITIKSPRRIGWDGIDVEKVDDRTVVFKLKQPYISFLDNTTIGILPSHIWNNVKDTDFSISSYNIKAIGSGPYKISKVLKNKEGIPESYILKKFSGFTLGNPHINEIRIISFSSEKDIVNALNSGYINQAGGITPKNIENIKNASLVVHTANTPRIFGIFYNSANNKIFADKNVVQALDYAINRQDIITKVLYGYGDSVDNPVPQNILSKDGKDTEYVEEEMIKKANDLLDKNGWVMGDDGVRYKGGTSTVSKTKKVNGKTVTQQVKVDNGPIVKLEFSLTTGDAVELKQASEIIKTQLAKIGVLVHTEKVYEMGPLNQIIRNRDYEAIFFGQIVNHESDLYSFWHSSQRKDPGLNIAMYNNPKVDKALEEAQKTTDEEKRDEQYKILLQEFSKDIPAILIYSPKYIYVTSNNLNNLNLQTITNSSDRFASVYTWYGDMDRVWKIFTNK